jgi:VanZ family protein
MTVVESSLFIVSSFSGLELLDYTSVIMIKKMLLPWLPAVLMMTIIFGFSSIPSSEMPNFGAEDLVVKKGGHVLGYGLLALAYWAGLRFEKRRWWLALLFAVIYAVSDEYHQSFVPGRSPSWVDALVIDGSGAAIALGLGYWWRVKRTAFLKNE